MNIGTLNRLITLFAPQPAAQNDFGESAPAGFAEGVSVWAAVKPGPGTEPTQADQPVAVQSTVFTIRYRPDVGPTWELEHAGQRYYLTAVAEIGRRVGLLLTAYSKNNDGN